MSSNQEAYKSKSLMRKALNTYQSNINKWPVPYQEKVIETSYGDTFVLTFGNLNAQPIVLLHGGGGNSSIWTYNAEDLATNYCVFAIDMVGEAGKSSGRRPSIPSDEYSLWLKDALDALQLNNVILCGSSLGGTFAHRFALRFPERLSHLVLLAPANLAKMRKQFIFKAIMASLIPTRYFGESFLRYMSSASSHLSEEDIEGFLIQFRAYKPNKEAISLPEVSREELESLKVKTLILIGDGEVLYDPLITKRKVGQVAPQISISIIPGAKHVISADQPKKFYNALNDFCSE